MSDIILEVDSPDVDIDLTSVRHAEDSFMTLNDRVDETSPLGSVPASEESQPESSILNVELDDDIEDEKESIDLEQQANEEPEEVSSGTVVVILKLHYR